MFRRLSFAFIVLAFCLYGCGDDNPTTPGTPGGQITTVELMDSSFQPKSITVAPGTTVRWVLRSNRTDHTVTDNSGAFDSGFAFRNSGDTFQRTFTEADRTFNYVCITHEAMGMRGSVRVGESAPPPAPGY